MVMKIGASAVAATVGGISFAAPPVRDSMPDQSWMGITRILVLSQVTGSAASAAPISSEAVCERARNIAAANSPIPVSCSRLGDPALEDGSASILIVQGAVADGADSNRLFIFSIRRERAGGLEPRPLYFGATPRALPLSPDLNSEGLDRVIAASLAELLPWLNQSPVRL